MVNRLGLIKGRLLFEFNVSGCGQCRNTVQAIFQPVAEVGPDGYIDAVYGLFRFAHRN